MKAKRVATYGLLIALAFLLSYIESILPVPIPIPGIKLGLANLVVICGLYTLGARDAFVLSVIRIILVSFTFGSPATLMFSMAGGLLSWLCMALLYKTKLLGMTGVSITGGVTHNIGQILVAVWLVNNVILVSYLPFLLISGAVTGAVIGLLGAAIVLRIRKFQKID